MPPSDPTLISIAGESRGAASGLRDGGVGRLVQLLQVPVPVAGQVALHPQHLLRVVLGWRAGLQKLAQLHVRLVERRLERSLGLWWQVPPGCPQSGHQGIAVGDRQYFGVAGV